MIHYWASSGHVVRPSVAFRVSVQGQSCTSVFLAASFYLSVQTLLPQKRREKQVEENANGSYFDTQKTTHAIGLTRVTYC